MMLAYSHIVLAQEHSKCRSLSLPRADMVRLDRMLLPAANDQ